MFPAKERFWSSLFSPITCRFSVLIYLGVGVYPIKNFVFTFGLYGIGVCLFRMMLSGLVLMFLDLLPLLSKLSLNVTIGFTSADYVPE